MPVAWPLREASRAFSPVSGTGRPIFRQDCAEYAMFYAPGCLCVVASSGADRFESTLCAERGSGGGDNVDWNDELWRCAGRAVALAATWQEEPFSPECLTLYMNNECNLGCVYCHTDPSPKPLTRLELDAIAAAAEVVAGNCRRQGRPLTAVFHGGGEPILHRERVDEAVARLEAIALDHDVGLFRYVATNGVMSEEKARWLARRFDLVGLSCDGPADVQNCQRPLWDGGSSAEIVERTAHVLRDQGRRFHVRTTITASTAHRQAEIAGYICQQFRPEEIHFEPVYVGGRAAATEGLDANQAGVFLAHFVKAREVARGYGIPLMTSGSRPASIHGPYCHVFRSVLNLVPGGVATACFKVTTADQVVARGAAIGALDRESGRFVVDLGQVQALRQRLGVSFPSCDDCFNRFHCARECPDLCPLEEDVCASDDAWGVGFRCRLQKGLTYATLQETAERLWAAALAQEAEKGDASGDGRPIVAGTRVL
jgi:uncharacterized protein